MNDLYQEFLLEEARYPFRFGEMAEGVRHRCDNPNCGDAFSVQVEFSGEDITNIAWQGQGCALSTAAGSVVVRAALERGISWLQSLQPAEVWQLLHLETVVPARQKCVWLVASCLQAVVREHGERVE